jgi:hypothetical protein
MPTAKGQSDYDIFISYASLDRQQVGILVDRLISDGFRVWYDQQQIGRGQITLGQLADAITASLHMIACLSDAYIDREYTKFELDLNQSLDPANIRNRTIPVIVKPLTRTVPAQIKAINFGNLTDSAMYDDEYQRIIRNITRHEVLREPEPVNPQPVRTKLELPFKNESAEPIVVLTQIRIAVEALCRFLYRLKHHVAPGALGFNDLVDQAAESRRLTSPVKLALDSVKSYSNYPVLDQEEEAPITLEAIQPGLAALRVLRNWFESEFGEPVPGARTATHSINVELEVTPAVSPVPEKPTPPAPQPSLAAGFQLVLQANVPALSAWGLTKDTVLVHNSVTRALELWSSEKRLWKSNAPFPLRCWREGTNGSFAAAGWDGVLYLFKDARLTSRIVLKGTVGDIQFHSGHCIAGTWKTQLVLIDTDTGKIVPISEVHEGIAAIATMPSGDWFSILDLVGGIDFFSQGHKVAAVKPMPDPYGLAFAGHHLLVLEGRRLVSFNLKGEITSTRELSPEGEIGLHGSPSGEIVFTSIDRREYWSIDKNGVQRREYQFSDRPRTLVSTCIESQRLLFSAGDGIFEYWQAREKRQEWANAQSAHLSLDGRRLTMVCQEHVEVYEGNE